jgi:hypothetical protein
MVRAVEVSVREFFPVELGKIPGAIRDLLRMQETLQNL